MSQWRSTWGFRIVVAVVGFLVLLATVPTAWAQTQSGTAEVRRGNILEWEQPLASRLQGEPLDLRVQMAPESILYNTLLLFGSTVVAAAAAFAVVLWWIARRGKTGGMTESPA